eukprot:TRINITY_DN2255_c0_g1_i1.p1 TRINITY_DN2255_c0_g1~~TRINITY_DN2255_c0_g1_i1.p1  ORF type:complete len:392 (+),score=77.82 TRINITY_DN2255_c0_g1_i1:64-1239(+)
MFNWILGGNANTAVRQKSKENQITEVTSAFMGTIRQENSLEVPFSLNGVGGVSLLVTWGPGFPGVCPDFLFKGKGVMQHPIIGTNGIITKNLPCLAQWGKSSDMFSVIRIIIDDLRTRHPVVYFNGETPVLIQKGIGETLGCTFVDSNRVLKSVAPNSVADRSGMAKFIGRVCSKVNNLPVARTEQIVERGRDPYIVFSFLGEDRANVPVPTPQPQQQQQQQQPPAELYTAPAVPSSFGLEVKNCTELQQMSTDEVALQKHFLSLPFVKKCEEVTLQQKSEGCQVESEFMHVNQTLLRSVAKRDSLRSKKAVLEKDMTEANALAADIAAKTSKPAMLALLNEKLAETERESEILEDAMKAGDASKQDQYRKLRMEYHLTNEKKKSLVSMEG